MRSFEPESGRLLYAIQNAHKEIASVAKLHYSSVTISLESEDSVRVWKIYHDSELLVATMEQHIIEKLGVQVIYDDHGCMNNRSDSLICLKQMVKTANFHVMGNLPVILQLSACGSDQFVKHFEVSEGKATSQRIEIRQRTV
ncbi:MAG: hypothetical protein EZS28_014742 [Streblomastix strix]|uniref:Uncharacterized protein n=1 Tax=Streblomastix strix TaxID=222440 RepID=A0A5J4W427_9EUKA|nr:MAG: hypothetical protein EZS28_014742 [Streblomastix strix]